MNLSDIMGASGLKLWAELGLVVSFTTFVALVIWLFVVRRGPVFEHESHLPLEDGPMGNGAALSPEDSAAAANEEKKDS